MSHNFLQRDNCGSHPIHYAAKYGFPATVKLLISKDSKINILNDAKVSFTTLE